MASRVAGLLRRYRATLSAMAIVTAVVCWPWLLVPVGRVNLAMGTRYLSNTPFEHHAPSLLVAFVVPLAVLLLAGCLVALLRQLAGQRQLDRVLARRGCALGADLQAIATRLRIEEQIVTTADRTVYAFCGGLLRPRIYLSRGLVDLLTPAELEAVVRHELGHVVRRDPLRFFLAHLARQLAALFPMLATLDERVRIHAELTADRAVLAALPAEVLASALVKVVHASPAVEYGSIVAALSPTDARVAALLGRPVRITHQRSDVLVSLAFAGQLVVLLGWCAR